MNHVARAPVARRERHKQQTRERLLDAAIGCFPEKGYDETTVDQIADRADVARATVFNHFPEKARFLSAYLERRRALLRVLLRNEVAAGADAVQRLYDTVTLLACISENSVAETRALLLAWRRSSGSPSTESGTARIFADLVAAGQRAGQFRADADAELIGALLLDAYVGLLLRWIPGEGGQPSFSLTEALHEVGRVVIEGLRPPVGLAEVRHLVHTSPARQRDA
jgi:TetR/AcrR family transcriptional regulator, cholesterol catabolism regulator